MAAISFLRIEPCVKRASNMLSLSEREKSDKVMKTGGKDFED